MANSPGLRCGVPLQRSGVIDKFAHGSQELGPQAGESKALAASKEECAANLLFKAAEGSTQSGLIGVEGLGCLQQASVICGREKQSPLGQLNSHVVKP